MTTYGDAATPEKQFRSTAYTEIDPGPYIGIVKDNVDETRMGGLRVMIPSLSGTDEGPSSMLYDVKYSTPFYGAKSPSATTKTSPYDFDDSPHSYGMWMVPPDIDTRVLVIFVEGKISQGFWFGCVQDPYTNHMVPGIAASPHTAMSSDEGFESTRTVEMAYGTKEVPVSEVNRTTWTAASNVGGLDKLKKPIHPFADTLRKQGLIKDTVRGTTTSSARRESPSAVFGISTPGRLDKKNKKKFKLGPTDANPETPVIREAGHTFVMDDGDAAGNNELIRLRTSSGHQLLMHDTKGVVYLANASGNVWMEFSANGAIDIYSGHTIALRAVGDIDLHSDNNINMFAKGQIKLSAMNKLVLDGGMIQTYSDTDTQIQSGGSFTNKALTGSIITSAGMTQLHMATDQHHLTGKQIHFNSIPGSPDMIATYERTVFYDDSGTGTLRETKPDIDLTKKGLSAPLEWTQEGNVSMSGLRMPTHEPFPGHWDDIVSFAGTEDDTDCNVPGTVGFLAQLNRDSENETCRIGQFGADLAVHMKKLDLPVTDVKALSKAAEDYTTTYLDRFPATLQGPFKISALSEGVSSTIKQTIESVTGSSINLLKDQVFVNQGGVLYSAGNLGQALTGSVQGVINDLSSGKGVFTTAGNILGGTGAGNILNQANSVLGQLGAGNVLNQASKILGGTGAGNILANRIGSGIGNLSQLGVNSLGNLTQIGNNALGQLGNNALNAVQNKIPGLNQLNSALGSVNVVNNIYKSVMGTNITSVTQVRSVVGMVGNQIGSTIATVGRSIGKIFGF